MQIQDNDNGIKIDSGCIRVSINLTKAIFCDSATPLIWLCVKCSGSFDT